VTDTRAELIADLGRGGYVYVREPDGMRWYFDKYLVLSRPGMLARCARLLADMVPESVERIAVTAPAANALGVAVALQTGTMLMLGTDRSDGEIQFHGEQGARVNTLLIEDVIFTGRRALQGTRALETANAKVAGVLCLLDREAGGAQRLADAGYTVRSLFKERELRSVQGLGHGVLGGT
jgi:orotate phosphoribosyltransferase